MLCAVNAVLPSQIPAPPDPPRIDIASEWRMVKRLPPEQRLLWLETTPGVEIQFSDLATMKRKLCDRIAVARSRASGVTWTDPRYPDRRRLTTECLCDNCRSRTRWPNYYGLCVVKRDDRHHRTRGWMSYECWLESLSDVEEGIPRIPSAIRYDE